MSDLRKELERLVMDLRAKQHKDYSWLRNSKHGADWFTGKVEGRVQATACVLASLTSILQYTAAAELTQMAQEDGEYDG